jgi:hypothetical protein
VVASVLYESYLDCNKKFVFASCFMLCDVTDLRFSFVFTTDSVLRVFSHHQSCPLAALVLRVFLLPWSRSPFYGHHRWIHFASGFSLN